MVIAVGVAFVLSFILYKDQNKDQKPEVVKADAPQALQEEHSEEKAAGEIPADTTAAEIEELHTPVNGTLIPVSEVSDPTFAAEVLGKTAAVIPSDGQIVAPCDGQIVSIYETGHAVCIASSLGGEILIHVGIDTVKMEGKGFTTRVADGDQVHAGDLLIEADLDQIKKAGYDTATMMILTNADSFAAVDKAEPQEVSRGTTVMTIRTGA